MRYFNLNRNKYFCPIVNLDKLWSLAGEEAREEAAKKGKQAAVIDVTQHGIFKVLGKGELPNQPVIVKARFFSKLAEQKIRDAGGACVLTA